MNSRGVQVTSSNRIISILVLNKKNEVSRYNNGWGFLIKIVFNDLWRNIATTWSVHYATTASIFSFDWY